jgi:hypothetical protein
MPVKQGFNHKINKKKKTKILSLHDNNACFIGIQDILTSIKILYSK